MSSSSDTRNPVERLAEEFAERYRRGERPALREYTDNYPQWADEIRELFPALIVMERLKPAAADATGAFDGGADPAPAKKLERLGDYRILREVGRGGMGVVYEAEQVSLGRHVALKILPAHHLLDPRQLGRFQREARAAARLHHTNIVPVFGVGEQDGLHYYVMQFIQGLGLHEVLSELRRLRQTQKALAAGDPPVRCGDGPAVAVAQSLLTGQFAQPTADAPAAAAGRAAPPAEEPAVLPGAGDTDLLSSSSVHLPGQPEHSALSETGRRYWESVARIGIQVADALAYANSQGTLHRDVKPSNLLLDGKGTVWVTDFGLAKATADHDNLTHTGDVIGTLRYMAPERFSGQSDLRGDIYSLGLTLYELLTLRHAFDASDRNQLIQQVVHQEPPRPRKLNPAVPRDLETVVLKAIARDRAHRYQTAGQLADDLRRFVEDKPIQARRVGPRERIWRWCRRNPVVAGLIALVQVALVGLLGLGVWSNLRISQALDEKEAERLSAVEARAQEARQRRDADAARAEALGQRDAAVAETYRALLNETRALRLAHVSGWRSQALLKLRGLATLKTPARDLAALRSEAVACLGGFDAFEVTRFVGHRQPVWSIDFSSDGSTLASAGYDGVRLWDVHEGRHVQQLIDPAANLARSYTLSAPLPAVRFRPQGQVLATATWDRRVAFYNGGERQKALSGLPSAGPARSLAFDRKGNLLAVSWTAGHVGIYEADSGALKRQVKTNARPFHHLPVALSPEGDFLATTGPDNAVQLHALAAGKEPLPLGHHRLPVRSLCFSPSGETLASASEDHTVKLWDVRGSGEPITLLGHTGRVNCVAFSPDGRLVCTAGDDETVRLWEARTGQAVMVLHPEIGPLLAVAFSPDGRRLATAYQNVCLYQLSSGLEQLRLAGHTYKVNGLAFHPLKPLLASGSAERALILWDLHNGRPLQRWQSERNNPLHRVAFAPKGELVAIGLADFNPSGGRDFAIELRDADTGKVRQRLEGPQRPIQGLTFDPQGKLLAAGAEDGTAFVWEVAGGKVRHRYKAAQGGVAAVAFLDQGGQLLLGEARGRIVLQDLSSGQLVRQVTVPGGVHRVAVAPDERSLAVGGGDGAIRFYTLPGLEWRVTLDKAHTRLIRALTFSPDGRLLASGGDDRRVILWDARAHRRVLTLPQTSPVFDVAFDSEGLRLAIAGVETLITVWNFALVGPELAGVGLHWHASPPPASGNAPALLALQSAPPVKVVQGPPAPIPGLAPDLTAALASLQRAGRFTEVVALAEKALKSDPHAKHLYVQLAAARYRLGRYTPAAEAAQAHLDLCPECVWAQRQLAACQVALAAHEAAVKLLQRLLERHPNRADACNDLAWIYVAGPAQVRNPEKALPLAQKAVTLATNQPAYLTTLGAAYYRLGKWDKAIATLRGAAGITARGWFFLAMSHQQLKQAGEAKDCCDRANRWWQRQTQLAPHQVRELTALRAEADALLQRDTR